MQTIRPVTPRGFIAAALAVVLAGCGGPSEGPAPTRAATGGAEQACLRDVAVTAGTQDVLVISSDALTTGAEFVLSVGEGRDRWRCVGFSDGSTAGIMRLTGDGRI